MLKLLASLLLCVSSLYAGPFGEAKVTKAKGSVIRGKASIQTGPSAKAELDFLDGSIARIGANARFSFTPGTRNMTLDGGTLLFSSPKEAGGATVQASNVTTTTTGAVDFEVANVVGQVTVISLSGKPLVSLAGDSKVRGLRPGQILVIPPGTTKLSRPDMVDLKVLLSTSTLMQMGKLPSDARLQRNARNQGGPPPISIPGVNNVVAEAQATRLAMEQQQTIADQQALRLAARESLAAQQQQQQQQAAAAQQTATAQAATAQQAAAQQAAAQSAAQVAQGQGQASQGQGQGNQGGGQGGGQGNQGGGNGNQGNNGNGNGRPPGRPPTVGGGPARPPIVRPPIAPP